MDTLMYFFDKKENVEKLKKEVNEWLGTPYKHRTMVKQKGVDCIHFIAGVFINLGALSPNLKYPEYDKDWHFHSEEELLYKYIHKNTNMDDIYDINKGGFLLEGDKYKDGDVFLYKFGKACSHAAFFIDNEIYHSVTNQKVINTSHLDSIWYRRLVYILRMRDSK